MRCPEFALTSRRRSKYSAGSDRESDTGTLCRIVKQAIAGVHQDDQGHWVAELACGHNQHVRHDPPWQVRPWVLTEEGRRTRLGEMLNCVLCDEAGRT